MEQTQAGRLAQTGDQDYGDEMTRLKFQYLNLAFPEEN